MRKITVSGINLYSVNNDVYGNPRYVVHYLDIGLSDYRATDKTRKAGFSLYRGKWFGGGFVFSSYSPETEFPKMLARLQ